MADPVSAAVIAAASIGTNIAGLIQAQHQQNWQNAAYVNELNNRRALQQYGMDWWQKKLADSRQVVKLTRNDLEELISKYKQKLAELA